ncbi:MAG TPA: cobalamin biosynthesis protein [Arenimonas sp.]|nr:cobalamin biosynthesis protein [Arenimonas sp.]
MMWTVMAVVATLLIGHAMPQVNQWRNFAWFERWLEFLQQQVFNKLSWQGAAGLLLSILLPALLVAAMTYWITGILAFVIALLTLLYTWGPKDLDLDVNAILSAKTLDEKEAAAKSLYEEGQTVSLEGPVVVAAVFENALTRWFAVLFWFLVFGPAGALAYRLLYLQVHHKHDLALPEALQQAAQKALNIAHCIPAHIMVFAMALAANFDKVLNVWREWYQNGGLRFDYSFLSQAATVSVASELADEVADVEDGPANAPALLELRDAISLAWRMMLLWLGILAVFVLAGLVN